MLFFEADARDGTGNGLLSDGCNTCCCEKATARPGEINLIAIDYRNWAAPLLGKGLKNATSFDISPCLDCNTDNSINIDNSFFRITENNDLASDLAADASLQLTLLPIYGPKHGVATIENQTLHYKPYKGYSGIDRLFVNAKSDDGRFKVVEIVIAVDDLSGREIAQPLFTSPVGIDGLRVQIDRRNYLVKFPIAVAPNATIDDIYRITINQPAIDCDCNIFTHVMCIDLVIGKCG